jgi:hypothetical protein
MHTHDFPSLGCPCSGDMSDEPMEKPTIGGMNNIIVLLESLIKIILSRPEGKGI